MNKFAQCALSAFAFGTVLSGSAAQLQAQASEQTKPYLGRNWSLNVGAALAIRPTYEGSDEYEVIGFPIVAPQFSYATGERSKVSFRGLDDIRYRLIDWNGFEAGPLAGYDFGREEDDGALLRGLGDIDGGVVIGGFVGYRFDRVLFDIAYLQNVTSEHDTGFELRLAAQTELNLTDRSDLTLTAGTTYASDDYQQTYFGIAVAQSAASGLTAFDAESGFKDVHLDAKIKTALTDRITLNVGGRYQRLIGDAADSPVVASEDQFLGTVSLSYRFEFGSR